MITSFEDVCLWTYVLVDDLWQRIAPVDRRPGPHPVCSDAELITMALIGACNGWHDETVGLRDFPQHRDRFPTNRRRCQLTGSDQRTAPVARVPRLGPGAAVWVRPSADSADPRSSGA